MRNVTVINMAVGSCIEFLLLAGIMVVLGVGVHQRNFAWKDDLSLWSDAAKKSPNKSRPHYNLGLAYSVRGELDTAIVQYKSALEIYPYFHEAHTNLGRCYYEKGWVDKAISHYQQALQIDPDHVKAHYNLGLAYGAKGRFDMAFEEMRLAKQLSSPMQWENIAKEIRGEEDHFAMR